MLVSETFAPGDDAATCFSFWYHALGDSVGSLRVFLANASNIQSRQLLWEINGEQSINSYDWRQGVVPVTNIQDEYKILIEGTVGEDDFGSSYNGDIA